MFRITIWFFVVVCGCASGARPGKGDTFTELQLKNDFPPKARIQKINFATKNGETRTNHERKKRGIVMVDSDFDIPSEIYTYENNVEAGITFGKSEGSGTDELDEKESNGTTEADVEHEKLSKYPQTTKRTSLAQTSTSTKMSATTEGEKNITSPAPEDGSGDEVVPFTETTDITTSHTRREYEVIPDICLDSTCSGDLNISVSHEKSHVIPEGTNFTFTCTGNNSNYSMLYWYKYNGSVHFLQAFGEEEELHLNIPDTRTIHSGTYMCVKWVDKQNCCNLRSSIRVYKIPLYNYHLLVLGLIAIGCLIICIVLSIRQSKVLKAYTKRFAEKHGSVKKQLI